jgi:L-ascorbate metabolism protein UlaG (beta-lactamase superfamily)
MVELTYFGNAAFAVTSAETTLLVDPYVSENPECPDGLDDVLARLGGVDAVCVTHAAYDHLGDAPTLATAHGVPVITEPATAHYLHRNGVPEDRTTALVWGQTATVGDFDVRALEARHVSIRPVDGDLLTGQPLAFLVSHDEASVVHTGDTSIFGDLRLFGELYDPDVALVGVGQARAYDTEPVGRNVAELTTEEAVLVSTWLDPDRVVPMHYLPPEREAFVEAMETTADAPAVRPMDPGGTLGL